MLDMHELYSLLESTVMAILIIFILAHLLMRLRRKQEVKIRGDSVVVVLGGCTGIGRGMIR